MDLHFNAEAAAGDDGEVHWLTPPRPSQFVGFLSDLSENSILYTPQVYQDLPVHLL